MKHELFVHTQNKWYIMNMFCYGPTEKMYSVKIWPVGSSYNALWFHEQMFRLDCKVNIPTFADKLALYANFACSTYYNTSIYSYLTIWSHSIDYAELINTLFGRESDYNPWPNSNSNTPLHLWKYLKKIYSTSTSYVTLCISETVGVFTRYTW